MKLAILCSGQGAQHSGMFHLTGEAAPHLFEQAAILLGAPVDVWLGQADAAMLSANRTAQILCTLQALAAAAALKDALPPECCVAGYSVGEVAAWGVVGLVEPVELLTLIASRAELMNQFSTGDGTMLFVRGLDRAVIERLCADGDAAIAIFNPGNAYVIGGQRDKLDAIAVAARAAGASRVTALPVNVASHTPSLARAAVAFGELAGKVAIRQAGFPRMRLFSGIDGAPMIDAKAGIGKLARQIAEPVRWDACMAACLEDGATAFLELGPGRALSDIAAATYPQFPARSIEEFRSLDGVRRWLGSVGQ
jgi:[acyl-carrier-protein] S-malonyltransferase